MNVRCPESVTANLYADDGGVDDDPNSVGSPQGSDINAHPLTASQVTGDDRHGRLVVGSENLEGGAGRCHNENALTVGNLCRVDSEDRQTVRPASRLGR